MTSEWFERKNGEGATAGIMEQNTKWKKETTKISRRTQNRRGVSMGSHVGEVFYKAHARTQNNPHTDGLSLSLVTPVSLSGDRTTPAPAATNTWRWWWWWCWWSLCWRCGRLLQRQWFSQRTTDGWVSAIRDCAYVAGSKRQGGFGDKANVHKGYSISIVDGSNTYEENAL